MRTWEKWYWGIDLTIMVLVLIGYHTNTSPNNYRIIIDGKPRPMTTTEIYVGSFVFFIGIMGLLWLIIRYFANRGSDKKER